MRTARACPREAERPMKKSVSICARNTTLRSPERLSHRLTQMFAWIGGMAFLTQNPQNVLLASGRS
ncbi:MAG: hypothetical protein RR442_02115, partial [Muribaculaceae bacterium]